MFGSSGPSGASSPLKALPPAKWFVIHRAAQIAGMGLFSVGFLLPWVAFGDHGSAGEEEESFLVKV